MSKAYKGMTKIVAETNTGGPYIYMENPYTGTIGAKGETWAEQIIYVVDAVETAVERHFEAENERLRAALKNLYGLMCDMENDGHVTESLYNGVMQHTKEALGMSDADELKNCIERGLGWEDACQICDIQPTIEFRRDYLKCARHHVSQRKRAKTLGFARSNACYGQNGLYALDD